MPCSRVESVFMDSGSKLLGLWSLRGLADDWVWRLREEGKIVGL